MRPSRQVAAVVSTLIGLLLSMPGVAAAATAEDVIDQAASFYDMTCAKQSNGAVQCLLQTNNGTWNAYVDPGSGDLGTLRTWADGAIGLDSATQGWMVDLQTIACADQKGVTTFVGTLAALAKEGQVGPTVVGSCTLTGYWKGSTYEVKSVANPPPAPSPTATPTPAPSPTPSPTPTSSATPRPSPTASPSVAPSPSFDPGATAGPTASLAPSPSIEPGASASPSGTGAPSPSTTVEPTETPIDGKAAGPSPTDGPPASGTSSEPPGDERKQTFAQSVPGIDQVDASPNQFAGSLVAALLVLLFMGFVAELFDNTVEKNYDEIAGWFRRGRLGRLISRFESRAGAAVLAFLALLALVSALADPAIGPDLRSLAELLGFFAGLLIVLALFKLPEMWAHRRATGDFGRLRPLPWALVIAALFALVSRVADLQPGYLYALVLGAAFVNEVPVRQEGREAFHGAFWTLIGSVAAWLLLVAWRSLGVDPDSLPGTFVETTTAAVFVGGLEAVAFGLLPMRFLPGYALYRWNRLAWGLLLGLGIVAFLHILIGPDSGYLSELSPAAYGAAFGVFAVAGGLTLAFWAYFRFRPVSPAG